MSNKIYLEAQGAYIEPEYLAKKIATFIFIETANNTSSNNWSVSEEEITKAFEISLALVHKLNNLIIKELETVWENQVAEVWYDEAWCDDKDVNAYDITLYDSYIPGFMQLDACLEETDED